jgi:hypothetical protein
VLKMPTLPQALALQAIDEWDIPNCVEASPSTGSVALAEASSRRALIAAGTRRLSGPSGRYNCFGLVFGNRRVSINSTIPVDIDELMRRDRCQRVANPEVGDLAVYRTGDEIGHVGYVSRLETLTVGGTRGRQPIVFVWSMWGAFGEFEHHENVLPPPYEGSLIEYWRVAR